MNIVLVGVCDVPSSTNTFMAKALTALGHSVVKYNYRSVLAECSGDVERLGEKFIHTLKAIQKRRAVDLVIFCKTDTLPVSAHQRASSLTKTFYWFMDPITTAKAMGAKDRALACDYASATCSEVVDYFKRSGQQNSYKINEGVDLEMFRPSNVEKTTDVLFVGSPTNERAQAIDFLLNCGIQVKVFGQGWGGRFGAGHPVYNADLVAEIRRAKIVLNVSRTNSYSDRVTLSMAAGSFVLTSDVPEISNDFNVGIQLETFDSLDDLFHKVNYYLNKDVTREAMAIVGCNHVHSTLSWETVCSSIVWKVV